MWIAYQNIPHQLSHRQLLVNLALLRQLDVLVGRQGLAAKVQALDELVQRGSQKAHTELTK